LEGNQRFEFRKKRGAEDVELTEKKRAIAAARKRLTQKSGEIIRSAGDEGNQGVKEEGGSPKRKTPRKEVCHP